MNELTKFQENLLNIFEDKKSKKEVKNVFSSLNKIKRKNKNGE